MSELLIIGYGNSLRGDDGFGCRAAEELQKTLIDDREVTVLPLHQLTPELAADLARAERAVFIDAATEGEAGRLTCREVVKSIGEATAFSHRAAPEALLASAEALYGRAPQAVLYSVVGESFELGAPLSTAVARALARVVDEVSALRTVTR